MAAYDRTGTIWDDGAAGEKRFLNYMDAYTGGTAWRKDYYPISRAWAADKTVSHGAAANGHRLLDIVGYIPVVGTVADAANAVWYASEGDWTNAAISGGSTVIGVLPIGKVVSIGGKLVVKVVIKGAVKAAAPALEKAAAKTAVKALAKDGAKELGETAAKGTGKAVKHAAEAGAEDTGSAAEKVAAGCAHSFPTGTRVELADGSSKPIENIKIGDKIRNADPDSHRDQTHRVDGIIVTTTDRDLVDLTLTTAHGPETLTTTRHHRIWDATTHNWAEAANLRAGHRLQTPDGSVLIAGVRHYTHIDTTYGLTIDHTHTYYVLARATSILVHNCDPLQSVADGHRKVGGTKFASEYTSPSGQKYYSTNRHGMAGQLGSMPELNTAVGEAGHHGGCAEVGCLMQAYQAEGPSAISGGSMRTVSTRSWMSSRAAENGNPAYPCGRCRSLLGALGISWE
ncbi:polymorphic toxin-type HINT domain-containing protein [Actinocatenispora rupis]|nr:polymorphic toxin-type HINT domain-containing protein [Actinocatenispora rupis]